jgi:hypothetical protein
MTKETFTSIQNAEQKFFRTIFSNSETFKATIELLSKHLHDSDLAKELDKVMCSLQDEVTPVFVELLWTGKLIKIIN